MRKEIEALIESNRPKDDKKQILNHLEKLSKELQSKEDLLSVYQAPHKKVKSIITPKETGKDEGTVLSLLSDIHIEHKVTLDQTNGINEQTPDTAAKKLQNYFINLVKRTVKNRRDINLNSLLMGWLGDFIHGFIHEEYLRTNYMTPPEATLFIIEHLEAGLNYLLKNGGFDSIYIVGKVGNHSRTTKRVYTDEEALYSYEWAIYKILEKRFPQINWLIEINYMSYFTVYDKLIRFHHGHAFKYQGGIGGIYVPLLRYNLRVDQQRKADLTCLGHWHTADWLRNTKTLINGSVVGFDAFAQRMGFQPEPPQQQLLIIDSKRGFTTNEPIILEEK